MEQKRHKNGIPLLGLLVYAVLSGPLLIWGQAPDPDDTVGAWQYLQVERTAEQAILRQAGPSEESLHRLLDLGLWQEAHAALAGAPDTLPGLALFNIRFALLENRFFEADSLLALFLETAPVDPQARRYRAQLEVQAWRLGQAERTCLDLLKEDARNEAVVLQLGRVYMLQKQYPRALALAEQVISWNPNNDVAYLLAAEVYLWQRNKDAAERALRQCLTLNPLNVDARFYYGYAIWRRVDASQLPAMAAQWELALQLEPLHYLTHWHWGNGHTHLTYADYYDADESEILQALAPADSLIARNEMRAVIDLCRDVGSVYFASVLPAMMEASAFYMAYDWPLSRLDSAQRVFQQILQKKPHYGPAHNGLAAVIKAKRFPYLASYDSLEQAIHTTEIQDPENFYRVFPDMDYYPGERVQKMVWNQLYASVVYFPFLSRQQRVFVIPPLHVDLARAMNTPYFRGATTFDNRQWMDIRGVGSGATAIEYVERGAHQERNVTLHEYVHLFHGSVFTDQEMRRVRALYYHAMENHLTLDYYSENNEFEYLAQTYTAYFIPVKVHPLNHKSINTRGELHRRDPQLFAFLDSLVGRQQAYLNGDSTAMASNWAEVYLNLSEQAENPGQRQAYLDTALMWDSTYVPVYLQYARVMTDARRFPAAQRWLERAQTLNPRYGPLYTTYADWTRARFVMGNLHTETAIQEIETYYEEALRYEQDYAERARFNEQYRQYLYEFSQWQEAIERAESYVAAAPTVSTYLRDRRDEAAAFAWELKGRLGYVDESVAFFRELLTRKPQHYQHRGQFARVLMANQRWQETIELLAESQLILEAAGAPNDLFTLLISQCYFQLGLNDKGNESLDNLEQLDEEFAYRELSGELLQIYLLKGELDLAEKRVSMIKFPENPAAQAEWYYLKGMLHQAKGELAEAELQFSEAVALNPYLVPARLAWLDLLQQREERRQMKRVATRGTVLPIPPGPAMLKQLERFLE